MKYPLLAIALVIVALFSVSVSAEVTCIDNFIPLRYEKTQIPSGDIIITTCTNHGNATSITLEGDGVPEFIQEGSGMTDGTKIYPKIKINNNISVGTYMIVFYFDDSDPVFIMVNIWEEEIQDPSDILIFPTSQIINVKQDSTKTQNILISVPESYPRTITTQSVNFNPGTETIYFGDLNLGQLAPGQSTSIPIVYSGVNAQIGTYQTGLSIFATDSEGQVYLPTINLELHVTSDVSPITGETFSTRPSCSLSSSDMNLNSTNTLTCSGVFSNLQVNPQYNEFFEGLSVDTTSTIYTYTFKPVKFGNTQFLATFTYLGSPIFSPFIQDVRIRSTSGQVPGTSLKFLFTPSLDATKSGELVAIQLLDKETNSLVENPSIEVNAVPVTNISGRTFFFSFESDRNYTLRGYATGYSDLVEEVRLTRKPITITITPETGDTNTQFTITTDINATIYINGDSKGQIYKGLLSAGTITIKAYKEGFFDTERNLTIEDVARGMSQGEFKKDTEQVITLSKNVSWTVYYQKDSESERTIYNELEGVGDEVVFTPSKSGTYVIEGADGIKYWSRTIEGWNWGKKWWFMPWYLWFIIPLGIITLILRNNKKGKKVEATYSLSGRGGGE